MYVRSIDRETFAETYLTLPASGAQPAAAEAAELYREMCEAIRKLGIEPIQEKIYAPLGEREGILAARSSAFTAVGLDPRLPCTYVDGHPGTNDSFAGLHLWGVATQSGKATTVTSLAGPSAGRVFRGAGFEILYLPCLAGQAEGDAPTGAADEASRMFDRAATTLQTHGHAYTDVVRTWIYVRRILDWYDDFNRVRTDFHTRHGIDGRQDGRPFPASTAIQGCSSKNEECVMDLLSIRASESSELRIHPILGSRRQGRAFAYGSGFSRAMSVSIENRQTVFVSGTASIDRNGKTAHPEDYQGQAVETLLSIAALLDEQGGGLRDIACGTLFYKNDEMLAVYDDVARLLGLEELPLIRVRADVCRAELAVEIEAVALL